MRSGERRSEVGRKSGRRRRLSLVVRFEEEKDEFALESDMWIDGGRDGRGAVGGRRGWGRGERFGRGSRGDAERKG